MKPPAPTVSIPVASLAATGVIVKLIRSIRPGPVILFMVQTSPRSRLASSRCSAVGLSQT